MLLRRFIKFLKERFFLLFFLRKGCVFIGFADWEFVTLLMNAKLLKITSSHVWKRFCAVGNLSHPVMARACKKQC